MNAITLPLHRGEFDTLPRAEKKARLLAFHRARVTHYSFQGNRAMARYHRKLCNGIVGSLTGEALKKGTL